MWSYGYTQKNRDTHTCRGEKGDEQKNLKLGDMAEKKRGKGEVKLARKQ